MQKTIEYAIASRITNKVLPKRFETAKETDYYIAKSGNPKHWKRVEREVIYGEWTDSN